MQIKDIQLRKRLTSFWLIVMLAGISPVYAYHIAGAEITYTCDGNGSYQFYLRLFRDCAQDNSGLPVAGYDDVIYLHIYESDTKNLVDIIEVTAPPNPIVVNPDAVEECGLDPSTVCREDGTYISAPINLPPRPGGYDVAWARCCRNSAVTNLQNSNQQGLTYYTHVPGSDVLPGGCNNSATWDNQPPLFICLNKTVTISQSATDVDGDQLTYQLVEPLDSRNFQGFGATQQDPSIRPPGANGPGDPGNPFGPPPYQFANFVMGYNYQNPLGPGSLVDIDPQTGELTFLPTQPGVFVVAYSVREFRNGQLIGETVRDIQFIVLPCDQIDDLPIITPNLAQIDANPEATYSANEDTIIANANNAFCFQFEVEDPDNTDPLDINIDIPNGPSVTQLSNTEPFVYEFCWTPSCNVNEGDVFPFTIDASDPDDCPNYNRVFDTLWVRVQQPPNNIALVSTDLSGNPLVAGDTIEVVLDEDTACFDFVVTSPDTDPDDIDYQAIFPNSQNPPTISNVVTNGDSITGSVCWVAGCEGVETPYQIVIQGTKLNGCPPDNIAYDTVNIRVVPPPNPEPQIEVSYGSTVQPVNNDTVTVAFFEVSNEELCIDFEIRDSLPETRLTKPPIVQVFNLTTGQLIGGGNRTISPLTDISTPSEAVYTGTFCWEVPCLDMIGEPLLVRFQLNDSSVCAVQHIVYDSTYVLLEEPDNPEPVVTRNDQDLLLNGDTLVIFADSTAQYSYDITDVPPAGQLSAEIRIENANGAPYTGPPVSFSVDASGAPLALATGIVYTPDCSVFEDTLLLIQTVYDSVLCIESHRLEDTLVVIVQEPENNPPTLTITDTLGLPLVTPVSTIAEQDHCVLFSLEDAPNEADFGDHLDIQWRVTRLDGSPLPSYAYYPFKIEDEDQIQGKLCVDSRCENIDDTLLITLTGTDSSTCTLAHTVEERYTLRIAPKPAEPAFLDTAHTLPMRGDTIILQPRRNQCVEVEFQDLANNGLISLQLDGEVFGTTGNLPQLGTVTGQGQLTTDLCWAPDCERTAGGVYSIAIEAFSQAYCIEPVQADTTIHIRVEEPENNPPRIDISDLPESIVPGDSTCFTVTVTDPDAWALLNLEGLTAVFDDDFGFGGNVRPTRIDTISPTELEVTYCVQPNCYQKRSQYELRFRASDSTNCDTTLLTEAVWYLPVDECGLHFVNVFTPNGDGINDRFGPISLEGIADFDMYIFDRHGRKMFVTTNGQFWNGNAPNGEPAPEGVYFYRIIWDFESGTGPILDAERTGHVSLFR